MNEVKQLIEGLPGCETLGLRLGKVIEIDAFQYNKDGKRDTARALACDCYLPLAIAKDKAGYWPQAAAATPNLYWASPSYAKALKSSRQRRISDERMEAGPRKFLQLLSCEIAPRLKPLPDAAPGAANLPTTIKTRLDPKASLITGNTDSVDLFRVVESIMRGSKNEKRERSVFLFRTLAYSWDRLYAGNTQATATWNEKKSRTGTQAIQATWLAKLSTTKWLLNSKRTPSAPASLVIQTPTNRAIYHDDPKRIALSLTEQDTQTGLPHALGMIIDPDTKEIIEQLKSIQGLEDQAAKAIVLLKVLAGRCRRPKDWNSTAIDGMSIEDFHRAFASHKLIYLPRYQQWARPNELLLGKRIFGDRRWFVPDATDLEPLWRALAIRKPTSDDCIAVLEEIGTEQTLSAADEGILLEIYQFLSGRIAGLTDGQRKALGRAPLWTGERFHISRPIFYTSNPAIRECLSKSIRLWQPPLDPTTRPELMSALKVTLIDHNCLKPVNCDTGVYRAPLAVESRFRRAVGLLKDRLMRENVSAYNAVRFRGSWERLENAELVVSEHLALQVHVPAGRDSRFVDNIIPVAGHVIIEDIITYCFSSIEDIGTLETGGRLVAEIFDPRARHDIQMAWFWAWQAAEKETGPQESALKLPSDTDDDDSLEKIIQSSVGKTTKNRSVTATRTKATAASSAEEQPQVEIKRLKSLEWLSTRQAKVENPDAPAGGRKIPKRRGLQSGLPAADNKKAGPTSGGSREKTSGSGKGQKSIVVRKDFTQQDVEDAGYQVLLHVFNGHSDTGWQPEILDFRRQRGIGVDTVVSLADIKKWVELKAMEGELSDQVRFTPNEFERARKEGANFYLAVVSGLLEGMQIEVRLYKNPLATLNWAPVADIALSGLKTQCSTLCIIDDGEPVEE